MEPEQTEVFDRLVEALSRNFLASMGAWLVNEYAQRPENVTKMIVKCWQEMRVQAAKNQQAASVKAEQNGSADPIESEKPVVPKAS